MPKKHAYFYMLKIIPQLQVFLDFLLTIKKEQKCANCSPAAAAPKKVNKSLKEL